MFSELHCDIGSSIWFEELMKTALDLIARFMGPTWGPSGADRTQGVGGACLKKQSNNIIIAILLCNTTQPSIFLHDLTPHIYNVHNINHYYYDHFGVETEILWENMTNTITTAIRVSPHEFQIHMPPKCLATIENANLVLYFLI